MYQHPKEQFSCLAPLLHTNRTNSIFNCLNLSRNEQRNKTIKAILTATAFSSLLLQPAYSADYKIDPTHSFVEFKIQHLGMSWLHGRFNNIRGEFSYDPAKQSENSIQLEIDPASIDTNHAERDKHLRSKDFLDVGQFPDASFSSTSFVENTQGGTLSGTLNMHGVSKEISINVIKVGEGKDPWGGYRTGFSGHTELLRSDFELGYNLGPAAKTMYFELTIEGVRQ